MKRICFFGTSEFAVPILKALAADARFEISCIVTQPDRPVGRHAILTPPPIKVLAQDLGCRILQPEKLSELRESNLDILSSSDAFVIVSYGKILPQWLLDLPKHGIINVHPSLLPRWRGPSPIQAAIASGDATTGVTVMKIDALMDHGPILAQQEEPIHPMETGGSLHDRLSVIGARMLPDVLSDYLDGKITPREQQHAVATTCRILTRDDGKLDWTHTAEEIERQIRAFNPWPGTWTEMDGKRMKIIEARVSEPTEKPEGTFFAEQRSLFVACGQHTSLELLTVQPEGKRPMSGKDFSLGLDAKSSR